MKLSDLKSNVELEQEGVWAEYAEGLAFKVARMNNPAYQKCLRKLMKPGLKRRRAGAGDEAMERCILQAMAKHVLVAWRNLQDDDGQDIPYSEAKALEILSDPAYHDIKEFIQITAVDGEQYDAAVLEEDSGN